MNDKEVDLAVLVVLGVLLFSIGFMCLGGVLLAWAWNSFLVPNISGSLSTISWWQATGLIFVVRLLVGLFRK